MSSFPYYIVKVAIDEDLVRCPSFEFDTMTEVVAFIEICFKNGYDCFVKMEEIPLKE